MVDRAWLAAGFWMMSGMDAEAQCGGTQYTTDFMIEDCTFLNHGANPYFILKPGYQLLLEGEEDGETVTLLITVLKTTKRINLPGVGSIITRVVEEREWVDDELVEVRKTILRYASRRRTYTIWVNVDNFENGVIVNHDGSWRAGVKGALPGIFMPGTFLLGSRYFQEQASDVARRPG